MAENNFLFAPDQQEQLNQGYIVQPGLPVNTVIQGGVIQQNPQNEFNGVVLNQVIIGYSFSRYCNLYRSETFLQRSMI